MGAQGVPVGCGACCVQAPDVFGDVPSEDDVNLKEVCERDVFKEGGIFRGKEGGDCARDVRWGCVRGAIMG